MALKIGILGCSGRVGIELLKLANQDSSLEIVSAVTSQGNHCVGKSIGELIDSNNSLIITSSIHDMFLVSDAIIDFSSPKGTLECLEYAKAYRKAVVCGVSGLENICNLAKYSEYFPLLWSANMSLGINALNLILPQIANILGDSYDIDIFEKHHAMKIDSPSGTALELGKTLSAAIGIEHKVEHYMHLGENKKRQKNSIGYASLRSGRVFGEHSIFFSGEDDIVEIKHISLNRSIYAKGALQAVKWLYGKEANLYSMVDIFREKI